MDPGDAIVVTRPTYQSALGVFHGWEADFVEIGMDTDGMVVDELEATLAERERRGLPAPKLVYDVPEFHNPTGVTLARARREQLIELANRYGMLVLEDEPYRRIRFSGDPVPRLQSFDRHGCVVGLGTFAKLVAPGLRIGWVIARPEIVAQMAAMKADGGTCPFHAANADRVLPRGPTRARHRPPGADVPGPSRRHGARGARAPSTATS